MKVSIDNKEIVKDRPYPKLMIRNDNTVISLFTNQTDGVVIWTKRGICMTGTKTISNGINYRDYEGTITLSND